MTDSGEVRTLAYVLRAECVALHGEPKKVTTTGPDRAQPIADPSLDPAKGAWPGNSPIDWWFLADHASVSMGLPTQSFMNVTLAARNLTGGPSNVTLLLNLGGSPAALTMLHAHIAATINGNPPPNVPAPPPA